MHREENMLMHSSVSHKAIVLEKEDNVNLRGGEYVF